MSQQFATPQDALQHYGVKGMKWGVRKSDSGGKSKPTSDEIKSARIRTRARQRELGVQADKVNLATGKKQEREAKKFADMSTSYLKNPDRVTAEYLTRGEKVALTVLAVGIPGPGTAGAAGLAGGTVAGRAIVRRSVRKANES